MTGKQLRYDKVAYVCTFPIRDVRGNARDERNVKNAPGD